MRAKLQYICQKYSIQNVFSLFLDKFYSLYFGIMLKPHEDAYGNNIYDSFMSGRAGYDLVEREDGCIVLNGDSDTYTAPFREWDTIQQEAALLVTGKVLDIGCGGGKHSLHFQDIGLDITGIDTSPLAIEVCRLRGLEKAYIMDISEIESLKETFDTILMLGNNWGLLENMEKARERLAILYKMTSPNAIILAETLNPYGKAFDSEIDRDYQRWNRARGRMSGQTRARVRYMTYSTPWIEYLFVSVPEMQMILEGTNWQLKQTIYETQIDQYIAVLEKK